MNLIVPTLLSYVLIYKYAAIFIITFLGAILLPVPSGTILLASTALSGLGYFNVPLLYAIGVIGNIAGDNTGYWLARRYGPKVLSRFGFRRLLKSEKFESVGKQVATYPLLTIYFSRFFTSIAPTANIIAGLSRMNYRRFLFFESLGEMTEVGFFVAAGYFLGSQWERANSLLNYLGVILICSLVLTYIIIRHLVKKI